MVLIRLASLQDWMHSRSSAESNAVSDKPRRRSPIGQSPASNNLPDGKLYGWQPYLSLSEKSRQIANSYVWEENGKLRCLSLQEGPDKERGQYIWWSVDVAFSPSDVQLSWCSVAKWNREPRGHLVNVRVARQPTHRLTYASVICHVIHGNIDPWSFVVKTCLSSCLPPAGCRLCT